MKGKVMIIGAGIAGPITAIQLKDLGYNVEIYESRPATSNMEGAFLGITPNGLNILKRFIPLDKLRNDYTPASMRFYNQHGQEIANLMTDYQKQKYGCETVQVKRWYLHDLIKTAACEHGINITYGMKCTAISESSEKVMITFENGERREADLVIACDGTFSVVRNNIFPSTKKPVFTKNISTGGYARLPEMEKPLDAIRMTFGERGFFAYSVSNNGEIWWFNNYYREKEPTKEELRHGLTNEIRSQLSELHKNDDPLFTKIINASTEIIAYPVYDIPELPQWYTRRVCLIGDAAHATSPHIGQGASLALEDSICLANCLKEKTDPAQAFEAFQQHRKARVEKIIKQARKIGNQKSKPNAITTWFRDKLLSFFIKTEIKKLDWIYGYRC